MALDAETQAFLDLTGAQVAPWTAALREALADPRLRPWPA